MAEKPARTVSYVSTILNQKTVIAGAAVVVLSIVLFWVGASYRTDCPVLCGSILPSVASVLLASGVFSFAYELLIRRGMTEFVIEKVGLNRSAVEAGLSGVSLSYFDYDYQNSILDANEIDIMVLYAQTWFNRYALEIGRALREPKRRIRLILPAPDNPFLPSLASQFGYSLEEVYDRVRDSLSVLFRPFRHSEKEAWRELAHVQVILHKHRPAYSYYRFDDVCLVGVYFASASAERRRAPVFQFTKTPDGLYDEYVADIDNVIGQDSIVAFDSRSSNGFDAVPEQYRKQTQASAIPPGQETSH